MENIIDTSFYMLRELRSFNLSNRRYPNRLDEYAYQYNVYNSKDELVFYFEDYFSKINTTGNYPRRPENGFSIAAQLVFIADEVTYFQKPPLKFLPYRKQFFPKWSTSLVDFSYKATEYTYTKGNAVAFAYLAENIEEYHKRKELYSTEHHVKFRENYNYYYLSTKITLLVEKLEKLNMLNLTGHFYSDEGNISIHFKANGTYELTGLTGHDTKFGSYHVGSSLEIPGFDETIVMVKSTRSIDVFRTTTHHIAVNCKNEDEFETISVPFCKWNGEHPQPTTFKRLY